MTRMKHMSEVDDFLKTGKKLNEFVEEEVDVSVVKPVVEGNKIKFEQTTEKLKQKVYYSHSPQRMVICGNHFFEPFDPKKYIFKCKKCDYHYQASTLTRKYNPSTGKLDLRKLHTNA